MRSSDHTLAHSHKPASGLALDLGPLGHATGSSMISIQSGYSVPAVDGRLIQATPLKMCLKFRPPTIAVVYRLERKSSNPKRRDKKYIHDINLSSELTRTVDLHKLTATLCERESAYLNPEVISRTQVSSIV